MLLLFFVVLGFIVKHAYLSEEVCSVQKTGIITITSTSGSGY